MLRKSVVVILAILGLVSSSQAADMEDYCQTPPFLSEVVAPNIMMMIDASGSMGQYAYTDTYDKNTLYEGYFDPVKDYILNADGVYEESAISGTCSKVCDSWTCEKKQLGSCVQLDAKGCKYACCDNWTTVDCDYGGNGNYLNWQNMARIDLLRWAMTGGRPDGCDGQAAKCDPGFYGQPSANLPCDADGCVMVSHYGIKVKARWDRITGETDGGLVFQLKQLPVQPRIGSMYYSDDGIQNTVYVGDFTSSASFDAVNPYRQTTSALNNAPIGGKTPIGPALWAARAYFAQESPLYGSPQPMTGAAGAWKNPMYQCFDEDNDGNCQGNELVLVPCAKNFLILMTDGQWNMGGPDGSVTDTCTIDSGDAANDLYGSADPVVPAYWMHKKGYTNVPTGLTSDVEAIYSLGLWLGGTGETSLQQVSMYGGFDTDNGWPGNLTGYPTDGPCTIDDCGDGNGSPCAPLPASSPDWDNDGNNIPDTFFTAEDALAIKKQLLAIIYDILERASSGTAVSVLSSSEGSGANLMQALFYPLRTFEDNTEVSWTSDMMNYWFYLDPYFTSMQMREDTVREGAIESPPNSRLDLMQDYIVNFAYDTGQSKTVAYLWEDTAGTGSLATATYKGSIPIEDAKAIWRAGFNLWWSDASSRTIFTFIGGAAGPGKTAFSVANSTLLAPYLNEATGFDANSTISYTRGYDCVDVSGNGVDCGTAGATIIGRDRTVTAGVCSARMSPCNSNADCPLGETCTKDTNVWKLGDIISSTPRIMGPGPLNNFHSPVPYGYKDGSYGDFVETEEYLDRQLTFVGANDGMLHAFNIGELRQNWTGKKWYEQAMQLGETGVGGIGSEAWSFIPKNAMPYLQYAYDEDYCHIYMVDGPPTLTDVSVNIPGVSADFPQGCTSSNYWECPKLTVTTPSAISGQPDNIDYQGTSWRTILIGSMGIGGATCNAATPDADRISTPATVGGSPIGWSSYFALDVTDQNDPQPLWEFSDEDLGVTNVGSGIVKLGKEAQRCSNDMNISCTVDADCAGTCETTELNGRWYTVLASGSTGPIADLEFKGTSDKTLKLFILDTKTGTLLRKIDTGIANAFAGSISANSIDLDKRRPFSDSFYQDDAIYIGYVQNQTQGGVIRLVMNNDLDVNNWQWSKVFADGEIGPVTTSVANLFDPVGGKMWIYFAEGRYFYKLDDLPSQRRIYGVQDTCFDKTANSIITGCAELTLANLKDQTTTPTITLADTEKGWYINMDDNALVAMSAERVISNPTPDPQGAVFFLSFAPTSDICGFGGTTYLWSVDYDSGSSASYTQQGKALIQVSTGEIKELSLGNAFTDNNNRRSAGFLGIPPQGQGIMIVTNPPPIKKFMHVQEQ